MSYKMIAKITVTATKLNKNKTERYLNLQINKVLKNFITKKKKIRKKLQLKLYYKSNKNLFSAMLRGYL